MMKGLISLSKQFSIIFPVQLCFRQWSNFFFFFFLKYYCQRIHRKNKEKSPRPSFSLQFFLETVGLTSFFCFLGVFFGEGLLFDFV